MDRNFRKYYSKSSYLKKLKLLFNFIFVSITLLLFSILIFFINTLSNETYSRNEEKLNILTGNVESELNTIEKLTVELHQNRSIQEGLSESSRADITTTDLAKIQSTVKKEINWLLADKKYVTTVILVNSQNQMLTGSVYDKSKVFQDYSLTGLLKSIEKESKQGRWFFNRQLKEAAYVQNIFSTRNATLKPIGKAIVLLNTSFIQDHLDDTGIFSSKDFFVVEYDNQLYATNLTGFDYYAAFIRKNQRELNSNENYEVESINQSKYYVLSTRPTSNRNNFKFYFFLLNSQVIDGIIKISLFCLVAIIVTILAVRQFVNHNLAKLIEPINKLATTMDKFTGEEDMETLKNVKIPLSSINQDDEIGVLYKSFDKLIHEIESLVIKDYQSRLLNKEIEYKFLQAQLNPHFLYNTLNTVNWLALSEDNYEISEIVTSLALLLRKKLDQKKIYSTVEDELEIVAAYLKIQSIRYKTRLVFTMNIMEETKKVVIPQLIIQPLVENSIKYGVEKTDNPVEIDLQVYILDDQLIILVADNGPGFSRDNKLNNSGSTDVGLNNIKTRLEILYDEDASININSIPYEYTAVTINLPVSFKEGKVNE